MEETKEQESQNSQTLEICQVPNYRVKYEKTKKMFVGGLIIVVIIGTLFYNNKKIEQYGGSYNICQYILG